MHDMHTVSDNATAASSMANDSQVIYLHKQCSFNDTKCSNIIFHQSFTSIVTQVYHFNIL